MPLYLIIYCRKIIDGLESPQVQPLKDYSKEVHEIPEFTINKLKTAPNEEFKVSYWHMLNRLYYWGGIQKLYDNILMHSH